MTTISASLVKELRDATGAGMMACKRALEETGGDIDAARTLLRERGMAQAGKRAGRETTEGKVGVRIAGGIGTIVAVGCETEPVSNNDDFLAYARRVLEAVDRDGPAAAAELEAGRVELVAKIGENVVVRGAARLEAGPGETLAEYVHPPANKIGVLVRMGGTRELARLLAMHVSFANPRFLSREEVPEEEVEAERAIYEKLPDVTSKPEQVRAKIVDGMIAKRFFAESVLLDQPWIHEPSRTVGEGLAAEGAEVRQFVRYALGK